MILSTLQNIAKLLHFAGCTLASLHPEPLDSFTKREIEIPSAYEQDDEEAEGKEAERDKNDKQAEFDRFAEAYYVTLNVSLFHFVKLSSR